MIVTDRGVFLLFWALLMSSCTITHEEDDEAPVDTETIEASSASDPVDTMTERSDADTNVDSDTDSEVGPDTADGLGGIDEECYQAMQGDTVFSWCDTPQLLTHQCEGVESGCCCRAACTPTQCKMEETPMPCRPIDARNGVGYCDYESDNLPVLYDCADFCTPRSQCTAIDTDGSCMDTAASDAGVCLNSTLETDSDVYCQPECDLMVCADGHFCHPVYVEGEYQDIGICLLAH